MPTLAGGFSPAKTTDYSSQPGFIGPQRIPQNVAPASYQGQTVYNVKPADLVIDKITEPKTKTSNTVVTTPSTGGFDMKYYPGWDPKAAQADWAATGGAKAQEYAINQGVNTGNENIERDYNDALMQADTAEQGVRGQAGQATTELQNQGQQVRTSLGEQQATANQGIDIQGQTATSSAKTAMMQARDLFRQQQQQNIAQLSALGLSSSSVMEGLAEKLGVETARRIGGVTGSLNEVLQNLSKERARVNDYAKTKLTELDKNLQTQIGSIQQQLLQGIRQIQDSRQLAATAKANSRANLMQQAQQQIGALQANAQQFAQQMQQWAIQKSTVLTDAQKGFTINPTDTTGLQNEITRVQGIKDASGQPLSYDISSGSQTGFLKLTPKSPSMKPYDPNADEDL